MENDKNKKKITLSVRKLILINFKVCFIKGFNSYILLIILICLQTLGLKWEYK